jgi:hypothetical protein
MPPATRPDPTERLAATRTESGLFKDTSRMTVAMPGSIAPITINISASSSRRERRSIRIPVATRPKPTEKFVQTTAERSLCEDTSRMTVVILGSITPITTHISASNCINGDHPRSAVLATIFLSSRAGCAPGRSPAYTDPHPRAPFGSRDL